jgi:DNA repair protein RecO (recombination protein O)
MLQHCKGLVIRVIQHKDRSAILRCYTDEFGLRSYVLRPSKKTPLSLFQPLTFLDMSVQERSDRDIQYLKEVSLYRQSIGQSRDVIKSSLALFIQEFLVHALQEETADQELFQLLEETLIDMDEGRPGPWAPHLFLVRYAQQMGILPPPPDQRTDWFDLEEGRYGSGQPIHSNTIGMPYCEILPALQDTSAKAEPVIDCTVTERREMLEQLLRLFRFHTDGQFNLKSPQMLREVLS